MDIWSGPAGGAGRVYGYVRVSTREQNEDRQIAAKARGVRFGRPRGKSRRAGELSGAAGRARGMPVSTFRCRAGLLAAEKGLQSIRRAEKHTF